MTPEPPTYRVFGAGAELFESEAPEVLLEGPAGTGKTRAACTKAFLRAVQFPGSRHLLVRKTRVSMSESVLVTVEKDVLINGLAYLRGGASRSHRQSFALDNGSAIVIGGMDNADRLMSSQYDTVTAFEATELTEDDWEKLLTRLRNNVMPYQQGIADCNPSAPTHWLNQRASAGKMRRLLSRHEDNPSVTADYLERLSQLTGVRRSRLFVGAWAAAEGVVYDGFDAAVHIIDPFPIPADWRRFRAIDFGFTNPFVCQWWAVDPDGRMYLYREIYHTRKTVRDHAAQIKNCSVGEEFEATVTDHDAEDRATLRQEGIESAPARKDVRPGLDAVALRLRRCADFVPDESGAARGRCRLYLMRSALVEVDPSLVERKAPLCTADEFDCYLWRKGKDGAAVKEEPEKVNDHGMDAMRYMVMHLDGRPPTSIAFLDHGGPVVKSSVELAAEHNAPQPGPDPAEIQRRRVLERFGVLA